MKLKLSDDLILPIDVITEKLAFLGRTGSGKTYAAMKLAELMLDAGGQIIALDPVGPWHGLRIGGPWAVYIFGGIRGDFPLEPTAGKMMANLIADRGISAVLDISQFIRSEQVRFASDFIEQFFHRKKADPSAVHLFLEEAQEFAPQNVSPNESHMLHHFERAWKLGRNFGIGGSIISQRPQEINKKVLNQAGTLLAFNMTGPQERKAIGEWTKEHGIDDDIQNALPRLQTGQPHVWSPTFLKVSKVVHIAAKITADVSMTPKVGSRAKEQPLTRVDIDQLSGEMAASIEKAKAEDPKELRKQILSLNKDILSLKKELVNQKPEPAKPVEVSCLTDDDRRLLRESCKTLELAMAGTHQIVDLLHRAILAEQSKQLPAHRPVASLHKPPSLPTGKIEQNYSGIITTDKHGNKITENVRRAAGSSGPAELGNSGLRRILIALAQYPQGRSARQVGILAGLSSKSGSFGTYLSKGRSSGWIEGSSSLLKITDAGISALGDFDPLPQGEALLNYWLNDLGDSGASRILRVLAERYPESLSKQEVGAAAGLSSNSGSFGTYLSRLRTLELIEGRGGELRASETLFE